MGGIPFQEYRTIYVVPGLQGQETKSRTQSNINCGREKVAGNYIRNVDYHALYEG